MSAKDEPGHKWLTFIKCIKIYIRQNNLSLMGIIIIIQIIQYFCFISPPNKILSNKVLGKSRSLLEDHKLNSGISRHWTRWMLKTSMLQQTISNSFDFKKKRRNYCASGNIIIWIKVFIKAYENIVKKDRNMSFTCYNSTIWKIIFIILIIQEK